MTKSLLLAPMDSGANVLLPAELQSGETEQLKASDEKSHEPGSSLERLCSRFMRPWDPLPASTAESIYKLHVQEKSELQFFWQLVAVWVVLNADGLTFYPLHTTFLTFSDQMRRLPIRCGGTLVECPPVSLHSSSAQEEMIKPLLSRRRRTALLQSL